MTQRNEDGNIDLSKYLPLVSKYNEIVHAYALCEVKVAGYRPSSILRFLDEDKVEFKWHAKKQAQCPAILTEAFFSRDQSGKSRRGLIDPSCPLGLVG